MDPKQIKYTNIQLVDPKTGGKHYRRDADGTLHKETVGYLNEGRAYVDGVADMAEFAAVLNDKVIPGVDVMAYGLPIVPVDVDGVGVFSKARYREQGITRTESHFVWSDGPGIMAMDYDPREGHAVLSPDELWGQLCRVIPDLEEHDVVWAPSSSSFVYDSETDEQLIGLKGQRLYIGVADATDIPRAADVLLKRMWLNRFGYIFISGSGAQLIRATTDPCMYQPSRLDYAGGAVCGEGLEQRRPRPARLISEGERLIDTREVFKDLTAAEERTYTRLVEEVKGATDADATAQREIWLEQRMRKEAIAIVGENAREAEVDAEVERLTQRGRRTVLEKQASSERPILHASYVVYLARSGEPVTVGDMLRDPATYEGENLSDPLEPDYGGGRATAIVYTRNRRIVSQAHGVQKTYVMSSDEEYNEIWQARVADKRARWPLHVERVGNVLDLDAIELALAVEDNPEAIAALEQKARDQKAKTEWDKARKRARTVFVTEAARDTGDKVVIDTADPNLLMDSAPLLETLLGEARLAFSYGGVGVGIRKARSTHLTNTRRDHKGAVVRDEDGKPITDPAFVVRTEPLTTGHMIGLLHHIAYFQRVTHSDKGVIETPVFAPTGLVNHMTKSVGPMLPTLKGVASHPVLYDGQLLSGSGYHEPSGLWLETGDTEVEEWSDPQEAVAFLRDEWLCDFPFDTNADLAAALMLAISLLKNKTSLYGSAIPLYALTAPSAGIGKSILLDCLNCAITGQIAAMTQLPDDREERGKLITSTVMESASLLAFDNVRTGSTIGNSYNDLHQLVTSGMWNGRVLGVSKTYSGPSGMVVALTGNNIIMVGDTASRAVEIRLVPRGIENTVLRDFKHPDILKWTRENRGRIIGALSCIATAKVVSVKPKSRFPQWEREVARPVLNVVEAPCFFEPWVEAGEEDVKGVAPSGLSDLLKAITLIEVGGMLQPPEGDWVTAQEINNHVGDRIMEKAFPGETRPSNQALTGYLRRNRDTKVDDAYTLRAARMNLGGRTGRKARWVFRVERTKEAPEISESARVLFVKEFGGSKSKKS